MRAVLTRDEVRAADAAALDAVSHATLVARAGTAAAHTALRLLGGAYGRRVVVVVGKGSNGADGRVAAAFLAHRGARVRVLEAVDAAAAGGITLPPCDLVIDGAYGTGFRGAYDAPRPPAGARVLAIDIPSGVDADTGEAPGDAVQADHTITFAALKPGLLQGAGAVCGGVVEVADIGIGFPVPQALLVEDADIALIPARPRQVNKWTTAVGVAAGSAGMEGAAILCTRGAMAAGSGMIRLGSPGDPVAAWPTEAVRMHLPARDWADTFLEATAKCKAVVIGPGLSTDKAAAEEIRSVIAAVPVPLVIDADALSALGSTAEARALLDRRSGPSILTPHDGEYERISGAAPGDDRLAAARQLARATGAVVLLKGPLTAVASPDGATPDVLLAAAGGPALATAGSGDVLSGIIGAFCARGLPPLQAAALAAHVHGRAASLGPSQGLVSGELPDLVAELLSDMDPASESASDAATGVSESAPVRLVAPVPADEDAEVTMAQGRSRPAWAEIDLAALSHNATVLARLVAPAELCAVVKAHGYGHGGPAVARAALAGGAGRLAVALVDEGVELREHGITAPVLLLSECDPAAAATALSYGLTPTLYSAEGIGAFSVAAAAAGPPIPVHVKVDTGMHRVGTSPAELREVAAAVLAEPSLRLEGIWTHLPVADGEHAEDIAFTDEQLDLFDLLVAELAGAGITAPLAHVANTAGAIAFPRSRHDMVRCGIGLYGYLPGHRVEAAFGEQAGGERLRPAMALKARVVAVRSLEAGERPSYGRRRPLPARSVVATVPIGYADGLPRTLFDGGYEVLIGGVRRPLAGAVTMDQIVVDCGDDDTVRPGDEVVLLGQQGDEVITADDWAAMVGTISYEVVCGVGPRMPRVVVNRPDAPGG